MGAADDGAEVGGMEAIKFVGVAVGAVVGAHENTVPDGQPINWTDGSWRLR